MKNKLTQDKPTLFRDQYGSVFHAASLKELRAQIPGKVHKMYVQKKRGVRVWNGYVIGGHWLTAFHWAEVEQ